jgi:hypothetical protein
LGAIAAALVLDPERALWVPGAKLISIPAPVIRPMFNVGDVVTFGEDRQRFVCMDAGKPDGLGATFAFLYGRALPHPMLPPLDPAVFRPPALRPLSLPRASAPCRS